MESPAIAARERISFFMILSGVGYLKREAPVLLSHFTRPLSIVVWRGVFIPKNYFMGTKQGTKPTVRYFILYL
jgi:hypothetical protein